MRQLRKAFRETQWIRDVPDHMPVTMPQTRAKSHKFHRGMDVRMKRQVRHDLLERVILA